ncbi:ribosome-associated ATPase/putative transporter RbbA [Magnetospirillum sp. 15-1]|uniref:ribosome-associated ATPase/putative transporter RbbA n=1 Tax=Magnetospirillum sp. 15-1 TaxID=1979370 RepID=UPI000BBCD9E2|nr:ribosome-associated ATPase/putative transporter RbbA [Magnetospirillum sp. 15-1]
MTPAVAIHEVHHAYGKAAALEGVSLEVAEASSLVLIGPDGVGKSSLLGLIAGAKRLQRGSVRVLGANMAEARPRARVQPRIAFMPQGLGRNLYPDLSVREHLEFFGKLFGLNAHQREERVAALLAGTGLAAFAGRPMGKLSGGMKQKLGLCCALIHDPDLLILDEPTTGVDPLSRRQFWELIAGIRATRPRMTVLAATSYMEEAEQFDRVAVFHGGRLLACAPPEELKSAAGRETLEEVFVALLPEEAGRDHRPLLKTPRHDGDGEAPVIEARGLTRRFGDFTAVDDVSFSIGRGEIFGFLGSNGCGKTTTMKMLTGLLPMTAGRVRLLGMPVNPRDLSARRRIGYMSQSFSLYGELTVRKNLRLHARIFHLPPDAARRREDHLVGRFDLAPHLDKLAGDLPLGVRQRLSLAVAILHEPEILILDEPTSGVDPVARDAFWRELFTLSRHRGVTIFVSTHFMSEAARCDRIAFMHAGRVLAVGEPEQLRLERRVHSLDAAFIAFMEEALPPGDDGDASHFPAPLESQPPPPSFSLRRLGAFAWREGLEILRDRVRLAVALFGTAILMLIFGYGITLDVEHVAFTVLNHDGSPESRAYIEQFQGSPYFKEKPTLRNGSEPTLALRGGTVVAVVEIPPDFGAHLRRGQPTEIAVTMDGAMPFRAETVEGYVTGLHRQFLNALARENGITMPPEPVQVETRFRYNQAFRSVEAMVPAVIGLLLVFIPAILMALGIVREKELGSITNFYVTPTSRFEFLAGKQVPYVVLGMVNFVLMVMMAVLLFNVPIRGSLTGLSLGALAYVTATTGIGLLMSSFTRTQISALFGTAVITIMPATQFSGMLQPVSSLEGGARAVGTFFPTTYFLKISVGAFTKGLGLTDLAPFIAVLVLFAPALWGLSMALLRKQER